jgi:hypothetical protein
MIVAVSITVLLIAILSVAGFRREWRMPVGLKGYDEVNCVLDAVLWASRDPAVSAKLRYAAALRTSLPIYLGWWARFPQLELAVLAPFIDAMIEGNGPPLHRPPEYENYRPRVLAAFKARMKSEGLWPADSIQ